MGSCASLPKQQKQESNVKSTDQKPKLIEFDQESQNDSQNHLHDEIAIVADYDWSCHEYAEEIKQNPFNKITNTHLLVKCAIELFGESCTSSTFSEHIYYYSNRLLEVQEHSNYKSIQETLYKLSDYEILAVLYFCESGTRNDQIKIQENTGKWKSLYKHLFHAILKLHKCFHFRKYHNNNNYHKLYFGNNIKCGQLLEITFDAITSFTTGFGSAFTSACGKGEDDGFVLVIDNANKSLSNGSLIAADVEWISMWKKIIALPVSFKCIRKLTNEQIRNKNWMQKHSVYVTSEYCYCYDLELKNECQYGKDTMSLFEYPKTQATEPTITISMTCASDVIGESKRIYVIDLIRKNIFNHNFMKQKAITHPTKDCRGESIESSSISNKSHEGNQCDKCVVKDRIIKAQHQAVYHSTMGYMLLSKIYDNMQKDSRYKPTRDCIIFNDCSVGNYEPSDCCRARGVVRISWKFRKQIVSTIKSEFSDGDLVKYMDKSLALQFEGNDEKIGVWKVVNFDFYHKDTDEPLFCMMKRQNESTDRGFKWKMENKLFTEREIDEMYQIPVSSRNSNAFIQQLNEKTEILKIMENMNKWRKMIRKVKWHKLRIFSATNKNRKMTLSLTKQTFTDQISQVTGDKNMNLIPILLFDENNNAIIEYLWIVNIERNIDIGVSLIYECKHQRVKVTGIHLDKDSIYQQHLLISPQHSCHCLDDFDSYITDLSIVLKQNKEIDYKDKYNELINILSSIANTSIIDELLQTDVNKIEDLLLQNDDKWTSFSTNDKTPTASAETMRSIDLSFWILNTLRKCDADNYNWRQYWNNFKHDKVTDLEAIIILYQQYEQNVMDNWISLIPDSKPRIQFLQYLTIRLNA